MQTEKVRMKDFIGHEPQTYWPNKMDTDWKTIARTTKENGGGFNVGDTVYAPDKDEVDYENN